MGGVKVVTGAAAAVLLLACMGPTPCLGRHDRGGAGARLSEQPAAQRAARVGQVDRRKRAAGACRAIGPRSRSPQAPAINIPTSTRPRAARRPSSSEPKFTAPIRRAAPASRSRRRFSTAIKPPTRPARRKARSRARAKALRVLEQSVLLVGGHDLHGLSARRRHRRGSAQQHPRARADAEADPGPLQCRRSDAHRRRAVGGAACRRQDPATDRRSQPDDDAVELPPHHRQRTAAIWRRARRWIASCRARCLARSISA